MDHPLCPSSQPDIEGAFVFGVIGGTVEAPRLIPLERPQAVTEELLALSKPVKPTEVFRFASPCAGSACQHLDGSNCRLAAKIVKRVPAAVEKLSACHLRPTCRWWQQEGRAACVRCPQIVTEAWGATPQLRTAADPTTPG